LFSNAHARVADEPLATRSTAAPPHHRGVRTGVDEHQPGWVKPALLAHPAPACVNCVSTLLLRRVQVSFEADITASEEPPNRAAAARDPAFAHRWDDLVQRKVRLVNNQTQAKLRMLLQRRGAAAAWLCPNAAARPWSPPLQSPGARESTEGIRHRPPQKKFNVVIDKALRILRFEPSEICHRTSPPPFEPFDPVLHCLLNSAISDVRIGDPADVGDVLL